MGCLGDLRRALLAALVLALVPPVAAAQPARAQLDDVRADIQATLETQERPTRLRAGTDRLLAWATLTRFYQSRRYEPAWLTPNGVAVRAVDLLAELGRADEDGLQPQDYHLSRLERLVGRLRGAAALRDSRAAADLDLLLSDAFLLYGSHLLAGRIDPVTVDPEWSALRPDADLAVVLERAVTGGMIARALDALRPRDPDYDRLKQALARFRQTAARGGWPLVPEAGGPLEQGLRDDRVRVLRRRLEASGDLAIGTAAGDPAVFDDGVAAAVRRFQRRYGLDADGIVGAATFRDLNTPVEARVEQIRVNLERWRWLPQEFGPRYLRVNIPAFELDVVEDAEPVLSMRVVVGRDYRQTPVFSGLVTYLVLNPYWNVPFNIAVQDILPHIRQDPGYLQAEGMKLFRTTDGRQVQVDPSNVDWDAVSRRSFPFQIRQDPGAQNALGRIKFMFPNRFNVYMHDTPSRDLFARTQRDFSSGCIRVEHPLELAAYLLRDDATWTIARLQQALATAYDRTVRLPEAVPVHLLYWTAWADEEGVHFRRDVYDRDARVAAALREDPPQLTGGN